MLTLQAMAGAWMLVVQGTGGSSSVPMVFPRNFVDERSCKQMGEALKKEFWAYYLCIPPEK